MPAERVPAVRVDSILDARGTPGAFKFGAHDGQVLGMHFICPCGCRREGYLPFKPEPSPSWNWDGNPERPTLSPSVQQVGGCRWHGWLRDGVWERV